jgi:hypothetical protein
VPDANHLKHKTDSSIIDFSLDFWYDKNMYLVNDVTDEKERIDLINHLERHEINFLNRIKSVISRPTRPIRSHEEILREIKRRAAEF